MKKAILVFKGSDCVPCGHFEPVFDSIFEDGGIFQGDVYKVIDDVALMRDMGVRTVPTVVFAEVVSPGEFKPLASFAGKDLRRVILEENVRRFNEQ